MLPCFGTCKAFLSKGCSIQRLLFGMKAHFIMAFQYWFVQYSQIISSWRWYAWYVCARYHPSFILFNHFDKHHNWIGFLFLAFNSLHFNGYVDVLGDNSRRSFKYMSHSNYNMPLSFFCSHFICIIILQQTICVYV